MDLESNIGKKKNTEDQEVGPALITQLTSEQWQLYRFIRLKALEDEPIAFEDPVSGLDRLHKRSQEKWKEILSDKRDSRGIRRIVLASEIAKKLVGVIDLDIGGTSGEKGATIQNFFVRKEFRGHGIGRELIESLLAKAKAEGLESIKLHVYSNQREAIRLYKSLGFVNMETIEGFRMQEGHPLTFLVMKKDLTEQK